MWGIANPTPKSHRRHARFMTVVHACTVSIVHESSINMVHACTIITIHAFTMLLNKHPYAAISMGFCNPHHSFGLSASIFDTPITVSSLGSPWKSKTETQTQCFLINNYSFIFINILKILCLGFSFGCSALLSGQKRDRGQQNHSQNGKTVIGVAKVDAETPKLW